MVPRPRDGSRPIAVLLPLALAVGLGGCLPTGKGEVRKDDKVTTTSYTPPSADQAGVVFAPKRTRLSVAILSRPAKDPAVDSAPWAVADEQVVPLDVRARLEANGLRVGVIRGALPVELAKVMNPDPPAKKPEVVQVEQPDGEPYLLDLAAAQETVTLLTSQGGKTSGKDYADAKGLFRVTAAREDATGAVRLKLVPEIRHGPVQNGYGAPPNGDPYQPKEFVVRRGQAEETFRELAATVPLEPGQALVVGGRGESARGLGGFLFTRAEPNSDRVEQRLVVIWAQPGSALSVPEANRGFRLFGKADGDSARPPQNRP